MTKTQRQHRISDLLEREVISTAAQLVTRLKSEGIVATQATVTELTQLPGQVQTVAQIAVESQGILASLAPIFAKLKAAWAHIF